MSMSNHGGFSEVISVENLAKVIGQPIITAFNTAMDNADIAVSDLFNADVFNGLGADFEAESEENQNVIKAYNTICERFKEKTGMELVGGYLDAEASSCDIETEEIYWEVEHADMWLKSPSLVEFEAKYGVIIERSFFSIFG